MACFQSLEALHDSFMMLRLLGDNYCKLLIIVGEHGGNVKSKHI